MILGKFFLKYEGGTGVELTPTPEKTTLKKPSLIRVNITETNAINSGADNTDSKYKKNEGYDFVILEDFESLEAEPEVKNKFKISRDNWQQCIMIIVIFMAAQRFA